MARIGGPHGKSNMVRGKQGIIKKSKLTKHPIVRTRSVSEEKTRYRKMIAFGWYGGKYSHLEWLLPLLPECHHYCEPFGGSAAVLLNRDPSPVETYNDLDGDVVNFFRVLREQKDELLYSIGMTPFSREEFLAAVQKNKEDWDKLVTVLHEVQKRNDSLFTTAVYDQVLVEIYRLLADVQVVYPTPNRVSLQQTADLVARYASDKSGGDRMEAVCTALFRTITKEFGIFDAEFTSGQNIYVSDFMAFSSGILILLGEKGRVLFLSLVGEELDRASSSIVHRKAWANLLKTI